MGYRITHMAQKRFFNDWDVPKESTMIKTAQILVIFYERMLSENNYNFAIITVEYSQIDTN